MAVTPLLGSLTAINPVLDYLRPRRSPYLIPAAVIAFLLGRRILGLDGAPNPADFGLAEFLFYAPVILIFALLAILSLFYRDPTLNPPPKVEPGENAEEAAKKFDEKVVDEIDSQLKFSRAMGVAVGAAALYYLLSAFPSHMLEFPTGLLYAVVLVQLATFIAYMSLYNIREESPTAHAFFQIGALMSIALIVLTLAVPLISAQDGSIATRCQTSFDVDYEGRPVITGLTDEEGDPRDATDTEIADVAVVPGSDTATVSGCGPDAAKAITFDDFDVYESGFQVLRARTTGTETFVDERFVVAASFFVIWLVFEGFWLRFLSKVVRVSVTVFDDAAQKDDAAKESVAKTRQRKPAA